MSDFDPKDVLATTPSPASDFDEKDVLRLMPGSDFEEQDVIASSPAPATDKPLTDADFERIGQKYGVDPKELKSIAPYYDAQIQPQSLGEAAAIGAKSAAGFAGRTVGFGLPQFAYKKSQEEPMRKAIDELRNIGQQQRSYLDLATEIATPGGIIGQAAKSTAGRLAGAIGTGGVIGTAESEEGKELQGAATGAAIGGVLGGAGEGLVKYLSKGSGKLNKTELDLLKEPRTRQVDMGKVTQDANDKFKASEDILEAATFGRLDRQAIAKEDVSTLLDQYYGPEQIQRFLDETTDEGQAIRRSLGKGSTQSDIYYSLTNKAIDSRTKDFAEELSGVRPDSYIKAVKSIEEQQNRQGPEYVASRYKDYVEQQNVARQLENEGIRAQGSAANKPIEKISGSQYVLDHYDDVYGTALAKGLSELSKDTNKLTFVARVNRQGVDNVYKLAKSLGRDESLLNGKAIINAIESGRSNTLDAADKQLADEVSKQFASIRDFANRGIVEKEGRLGDIKRLAIPEIQNYVTRSPVDIPDMVVTVENTINRLKEDLSKQLNKPITDLAQVSSSDLLKFKDTQGDLKNLTDFLSWKQSKKYFPKGGGEMSGLLKDALYTQDGNIALERIARSSLARSDETPVPAFIRENNLYKLLDKYSNDILSTLYKRRGIDMLRKEAFKLKKLGAEAEASYVERIIQDTLGTRKGTAAAVMNSIKRDVVRNLSTKIQQETNPIRRGALELIKSTPDIISFLGRQIYPNVLGWLNPRPILQNALSGITRTAPELGGSYGYTTYLRGLGNAAKNLEKLTKEAQGMGLIPEEFTREGQRALAEGIRRSGVIDKSVGGYEKLAKFGMSLYQKSEELNRAAILGTAKMMSSDLARNSKSAIGSLSRFPLNVRKEVLANINNPEQTYRILAKYLNDRTAFNYNRQSMFELGRELGPIFSTFSKWPTEIAGEAIYDLRSKGAVKGLGRMAERLMLPIMALASIDYLVNREGLDGESYKKIIGSKGLKSASPGNALVSFAEGGIFTPPAVDAIMSGVISPVLAGKVPETTKGLESLAYSYVPGAGLLKRITEDMATIITNEKPEGSYTTEKVIEGARMIGNKVTK